MSNFVDTVEDRIHNSILATIDNIITPRIELAVSSINASSGRDAASGTANSERGERVGTTDTFENISEKSNTFHELSANNETRRNVRDEVSDLSFQEHILTGNHALITDPFLRSR